MKHDGGLHQKQSDSDAAGATSGVTGATKTHVFAKWTLALVLTVFGSAWAEDEMPFVNDYGGVGLWQIPSARFAADGGINLGVVSNSPYNRLFITISPFSAIEATFRYTEIKDRLYSNDPTFSGRQSLKDRGFDVRAHLLKESGYIPDLALGFRDISGTQLFGSQYLVASHRYDFFDFTLGLGWGRLGSGGPIDNPFKRNTGPASITNVEAFSSSRIGIFGGVTWDTPIEGLQLLAEYDSNNYQHEPEGDNRHVRFPVNAGFKYQLFDGVNMGMSYERGSILSFQLYFSGNLANPHAVPKVLDPAPPMNRAQTVSLAAAKGQVEPDSNDPAVLGARVERSLKVQRIALKGFALAPDGQSAQVWVPPTPYRDSLKQLGRAARATSAVLPDSVSVLRVTEVSDGVPTYDAMMFRPELEQATRLADSSGTGPAGRSSPAYISTPSVDPATPKPQYEPPGAYPAFGWSINPAVRSSVGGPDQFYFGQLLLKLGGYVNLTPGWSIDSVVALNIYNNFNDIRLNSNSKLPHVRSDIKEYLQQGQQAFDRLETNYIFQLQPKLYGRLSAGIFEEMYGGVAGEVLYRPESPYWAVGMNVNRVRQRGFNGGFDFRDYEVTTGNLTGYFEFPKPSVLVKLSVGQYLAGDRGATLDISRQFPSGVRVGIFATKTNVSAAQFGEGQFDKGFYLTLPLDVMLPRSSTSTGTFSYRPLTRDGGQMVRDGRSLYDITSGAVRARLPLRDGLFFE